MARCKGCGARMEWITTRAGKHIPVDPEPVQVIEGDGRDIFVTDEGDTVTGRIAEPDEMKMDLTVGFVPHWKTCPNAADFRRPRK